MIRSLSILLFFAASFLGLKNELQAQCTGTPISSFTVTNLSNVSCFNGSDGSIEVTLVGGQSPFTYSLVVETGFGDIPIETVSNTALQVVTFSNLFAGDLAGGTYRVNVVTSNGGTPILTCTRRQVSGINLTQPTDIVFSTSSITPSCNGNDGAILVNAVGGTPGYNFSWVGITPDPGNTANPTGLAPGTYDVTVTDAQNCSKQITGIVVPGGPDAGLAASVNACNNNAAFNLFASLGGTPDGGGVWSQISGSARTITGNNVDLNGATAGAYVFRYTVTAAPCTPATADVTVNVVTAPNAGLAAAVNACNNAAAFNLFASLGGTPDGGGVWSQISGSARTITGNNVDLNGATAGAYVFRYTVTAAPCTPATADVTVNVVTAPNAGLAASVNACNNNATFNLFTSLGGTPDGGGVWSQISGSARTITGNNVDLNGATAGAYVFRYTVTAAPCTPATADVTVNVVAAPNAGLAAAVNACNNAAAFNLFASLGGTPDGGGVWSQISGSARTITGNNVDLNGATAGAYVFRYTVTAAPCTPATADVTVNVIVPNAGLAAAVNACNTVSAFNLFTSLGGTPDGGGVWSQISGSARTITGNNVDLNGATAGAYVFRYTVTAAPCTPATADVTVNVVTAPNAGLAASVNACNNNAAFNLFTSLGGTPDGGGVWSQISGSARTITGNNVDLNGATAGAYVFRYTVTAAPCTPATADVTVNVVTAPNAGLAASVNACNNNAAFNLFASLGGTPDGGGVWSQISGSARTITGNNVDLNGATAGAYVFRYTVTAAPCTPATADVTVNVVTAPNAGLAASVNACNTAAAFNLFSSLGGTPDAGGVWSQISGLARTITGNNVDLNGATAGAYVFRYTVTAAPCTPATADVTVNVVTAPNAGLAAAVSACNNNAAFNLFTSLGGTPDGGGVWSQISGSARTITGNNVDLNGATAGAYVFRYTVTAAPCTPATADVTVNVVTAPNAGLAAAVSACNNNATFNLFTSLGGTPDGGGVWSQISGSARTITGNNVDLNGATAGAYVFRYTVTAAPCTPVTADVTVNVVTAPNAGLAAAVSACNNNAAFNLFTSLGGTPDGGGVWSQISGSARTITGNNVDLNGATAGAYVFRYTVTAAPCTPVTADVTVNVVTAPNAGLAAAVNACNTAAAFNLFSSLGGTPDAGGVWSQISGSARTITGNNVDLNGATAGAYVFRYTVTAAPCTPATADVTVNVVTAPNAGLAASINACNTAAAFNLFTSLGGTPDVGGVWSQISGSARTITGNNVDLNGATAGAYVFRYTVTAAPCTPATADVTVNVVTAPNAGLAASVNACNTAAAFNLFTSLGGTPDGGGVWSQISGSARTITGNNVDLNGATAGAYVFRYTVTAAPCTPATADVTVNVIVPNAGLAAAVSACNNNATFNLFTSLGGTPDGGGVWSQISGSARTITGNNVDLNGATAGAYVFRYTVTAAPCTPVTADVTVNVVTAPNAGLAASVNACNTAAAFNLFSSLGGTPDAGGVWSQISGSARTITGNNVDLNGATAGAYVFRYTVTAAPCTPATADVTVNVVTAPNAGLAAAVSACNNNATFNLFTSLGGTPDAGGVWSQISGSARTITGNNVDLNGATAGAYVFRYTVTAAPCTPATADVTVNVVTAPNAGLAAAVNACNTVSAFNLFTSLGGTPDGGGVWSQISGSARTITGNNVDLNGATAGTYVFRYTVTAAPCTPATADVMINLSAPPTATVSVTNPTICAGSSTNINITFAGTAPWTFQVFDGTTTSAPQVTAFGLSLLVNPAVTTTFTIVNLSDATGCSVASSGSAQVTVVNSPDISLGVTANITNLCTGGSTEIVVANSQSGVSYQLRNDANDANIGAAVIGTGGNISLPTGILTATTPFNVLATVASCPSVELTAKPTVTVSGTINSNLAVNVAASILCEGNQTNITIVSAENGVLYQLRNDADNSLIGAQVPGTGADLVMPTGTLTANTTFNIFATNGSCSVELVNQVTVNIDQNPDISLTVNGPASTICEGGTASVEVLNSEIGVSYQLRDDLNGDALSGAAVVGTGATITLISAPLTSSTTLNILASSGVCTPAELTTTVPVTVNGTIDISLAATPAATIVCENTGTTIEITNPEAGVNYTLRNDATNAIVNGPLNGASVIFNTGNLTATTTFNILAENGSCTAELTNQVTVQVVNEQDLSLDLSASANPVCSGGTTSIQVINSEVGVNYQLRLHPSNTLVGTPVAGNGGIIVLPTDVLLADTDFNVEASNGVCTANVLSEIVTVTIGAGTLDNSLTTSSTSATLCVGGTTFVQVLNSEAGVSYQLRNDADDSNVNAPVTGNGATINLPTGNLTTTTTFNVLAGSGTCSIELTDTETITVNPTPSASLVVTSATPTTCVGSSVNITIEAAQNGILYDLRNDAGNVVLASGTGTGADLVLSSGALTTSTTFNVLASNGTCSTELSTLISVVVNNGPDASRSLSAFPSLICAGASSAIVVASQNNIVYQLRLDADDSNVGGAFLGNGFSINLPTADIASTTTFNVLASNIDGSCAVELAQTITITTRATNDPLCGSAGGGIGNENCTLFTTTIVETKPGCNGDDDGQLSFDISGGTPSPNYTVILIDSVFVGGTFVSVNQTSETGIAGTPIVISGLKPAQYYYRILDGSGNICTLPFKLDRQANVTAVLDNKIDPTCIGDATGTATISITGGGSAPYEYSIIGDFTDAQPFVSGQTITNIPAGTAAILIRDDNTDTCPAEVQVNVGPGFQEPVSLVSAIKQDASCNSNDGSIIVTTTGGVAPFTYKFGLVGGEEDIAALPSNNTFTALAPGTYSLIVSDASGCAPKALTLPAINFPGIVSTNTIVVTDPDCAGNGQNGSIAFNIENNFAGQFQVAVLTDFSVIPTDADFVTASPNPVFIPNLASGDYFVWVKSINALCPTRIDPSLTRLRGAVRVTFTATAVNEECFGEGGSILLSNVNGIQEQDYEYVLSSNNQTLTGNITFTASLLGAVIEGVVPGVYSLILRQPGSTESCESNVTTDLTIVGPNTPLVISDPTVPRPQQETSFEDDPTAARVFVVSGGSPVYFMQLQNAFDEVVRPETEVLLVNTSYSQQYSGLGPGTYTAIVEDDFGCVAEKEFVIGVKTDIFIPNVFTPDNDPSQRNEVFFIRNLAAGSKLVISNRWGNEVYSSNDYQNDWNAEGVSDGVYYYNLKSGGQEFTGWVEILRGNKP